MIENLRKYPSYTVTGLSVYYLVGIIGLSIDRTHTLFQSLVPFTLLFSLYFLWLFHEGGGVRFYSGATVIFLAGFFIEVAGVNTGMIFGEYSYGKTLGIQVWNTPLIIGINWLILVYSCRVITAKFIRNRWWRYLAGATLLLIYDIVLEPAAIRLDMWTWAGGNIPLQNYAGWFISSMMLFIILDFFVKDVRNKIAPALFIIQFAFFLILDIIHFYFS
jgi:putative membrane protein